MVFEKNKLKTSGCIEETEKICLPGFHEIPDFFRALIIHYTV